MMNDSDQTRGDVSTGNPADINRGNRHACERCRKSKVRCLVDTLEEHGKCRRCFEADAQCNFAAIAPRQRRKRTDARVTNLEKQLSEMKYMFNNLKSGKNASSASYSSPVQKDGDTSSQILLQSDQPSVTTSASPSTANVSTPHPLSQHQTSGSADEVYDDNANILSNVLRSQNLTKTEAAKLFTHFVKDLLPQYGIVKIDENTTFESLYRSRPILLFAAISAAACSESPTLFQNLHKALLKTLAEKIVIEGEKSLELLQAILIMKGWYDPPSDIKRLNFYQWIHIAGTMALQLGIGGRLLRTEDDFSLQANKSTISEAQLAAWRTMFAVYISCSSVAISLRRQRMISFTPVAEMRLTKFEQIATSLNDKRLAANLRLQLIADEVENAKIAAETSEPSTTLNPTLQKRLRELQDRFRSWESSLEEGVMNGPLKVHLHFCEGKLFERLMHTDSHIEELAPPGIAEAPLSAPSKSLPRELNPIYVRAMLGFINACHATLDAVLNIRPEVLRSTQTLTLVRAIHAMKALKMLDHALHLQHNDVGKIIDSDSLRFQHYAQLLDKHLSAASGELQCRVPVLIREVVQRFAGRDENYQNDEQEGTLASEKINLIQVTDINGSLNEAVTTYDNSTSFQSAGNQMRAPVVNSVEPEDLVRNPPTEWMSDFHNPSTNEPFVAESGVPFLERSVFDNNYDFDHWEPPSDFELMMMPDIAFTSTSEMDFVNQPHHHSFGGNIFDRP